MKYKAIIYDLDGTLIDTFAMNFYPLIKVIKEELNQDMTYQEALKYVSYPGEKTLELLGVKDIKRVYQKWVQAVYAYPQKAKPYPDIVKLLKQIPIKQAVVSSKKHQQYQIDVVEQGLDQYFALAVLEEDTKKHKPDPEPLLKCLEKLNIKAHEALYIGDGYNDYLAAKQAKIDFGYALWGVTVDKRVITPYVFNTPLEVMELLKFV